jgi:hypothetical protein
MRSSGSQCQPLNAPITPTLRAFGAHTVKRVPRSVEVRAHHLELAEMVARPRSACDAAPPMAVFGGAPEGSVFGKLQNSGGFMAWGNSL